MHRNPDLTSRVAEVTEMTRILGPTRKGHDDMFDNLEAAGLRDAVPSMVINIDESDSQAKRSCERVIGPRYNIMKRLSVPDASVNMHISLVAAARANGLPYGKPIFILSGARISSDSVEDSDEYLVICTKSGGMEGYAWEECCNYWAGIAKGGEIFIIDGHSSHEDFLANEVMAKKGLKVVTLDPHCTHIYQVRVAWRSNGTKPASRPLGQKAPQRQRVVYEALPWRGFGGDGHQCRRGIGAHFTSSRSLHFHASPCTAPGHVILPSLAHKDHQNTRRGAAQ